MSCTETSLEESPAADRGEGSARLEALYLQHGDALRRLCRRRLGNDRDAEDAAQEALLRAWGALDGVDPDRPIWPWLATIAGNVCIDLQRRARTAERRRPPREPAPMSPEEHALSGDRDGLVREALGTLPRSSQQVLFLRDIEGWSYGSIGVAEGRSAPAVRVAVTRARHQLRTQVEAMARATGRWPLTAFGVVSARASSTWRRVRSGGGQVATRWTPSVDASTAIATFSASAAAQTVCGALLLASVGAVPGLAWGADPGPVQDRVGIARVEVEGTGPTSGAPAVPARAAAGRSVSGGTRPQALVAGQPAVQELDLAMPAPPSVDLPAPPAPQVVAVPPSPPAVPPTPLPELPSPPTVDGRLLVSSIG